MDKNSSLFTTPVAFFIYNRPAFTEKVFAAIQQLRPSTLFIIADGPRADQPEEVERCEAARQVTEKIDWECAVLRKYANTNLGCRLNVSSGIDWVFEKEEEAIFLEDDCLPDSTFFSFCAELLERYRNDERIGMIGGVNFSPAFSPPQQSYFFSHRGHIWGWASWRRAWKWYDLKMKAWPELRKTAWLNEFTSSAVSRHYWRALFDDSFSGDPDGLNTWDLPWTFATWRHRSFSIVPSRNLVTNLGTGAETTHHHSAQKQNLARHAIPFPLVSPEIFEPHRAYDEWVDRRHYYGQSLPQNIFWHLRLPISLGVARKWQRKFQKVFSLKSR